MLAAVVVLEVSVTEVVFEAIDGVVVVAMAVDACVVDFAVGVALVYVEVWVVVIIVVVVVVWQSSYG